MCYNCFSGNLGFPIRHTPSQPKWGRPHLMRRKLPKQPTRKPPHISFKERSMNQNDEALRETRRVKKRRMLRTATRRGTSVQFVMRCLNGHHWGTTVEPATVADIQDMTCPSCGAESSKETSAKGTVTESVCTPNCWTASFGTPCHCSCGGIWHGSVTGPQSSAA